VNLALFVAFVVLMFCYGLFSRRLERTVLTGPILFAVAGLTASRFVPDSPAREAALKIFLGLAELGLVLLLFTDASRVERRVLRSIRNLPVRLLSSGMLLTIVLGALAALVVFRQLTIWEAGILAAILAPTDAGLGQIIVTSPLVPVRIRQALNVEAGLNDGLSVPFMLFFIALAASDADGGRASLMRFVVEQLGYGVAVGLAIGLAGGVLLGWAHRRGWVAESLQQLAVVTLPLLCLIASEAVGASMFIAAFVAGLAVQAGFKEAGRHSVEFTDQWGQLLNLSVFFLFGLHCARAWPQFAPAHWLYALLSLTVVRMLPVAVALYGTKLTRATVLFMGWFGPRGLASIVLGLVYLEQEIHLPGEGTIRLTVMATVMLSILAHGLSGLPGINWYAGKVKALPDGAPERQAIATNSAD
jgi:NhaP-type Na+/H+ or K+/H+ antiporter